MSGPRGETPTDETPTDAIATGRHSAPERPLIPRLIRTFALPIILAWIVIVALLNTVVPQLEVVGKMRAVSMSPNDAPSMIAIKEVGKKFQEYDTSSSVMVVLEGDKPLGSRRTSSTTRWCATCAPTPPTYSMCRTSGATP